MKAAISTTGKATLRCVAAVRHFSSPGAVPFLEQDDEQEPRSLVRYISNKQLKKKTKPGPGRTRMLFLQDHDEMPADMEPSADMGKKVKDPSRFRWRHLADGGKNDDMFEFPHAVRVRQKLTEDKDKKLQQQRVGKIKSREARVSFNCKYFKIAKAALISRPFRKSTN